uniref:Uncharacterized protein n=1 Tax=Kwoniella bestiolae CBS 10118 TaxID=1296100 RepID=A0A1B9G5T0_9TREE|nr:hypothetical protein I302_04041 [Kwoniella bestiolae CBS 10118]OCF26358.1 hypothetical protein I302_04041 [Kwoniella bestiolae CBS 10118]
MSSSTDPSQGQLQPQARPISPARRSPYSSRPATPSSRVPPQACPSSLPSQGTIHIPDLLDVLMQPVVRSKKYLNWDREAYPISSGMIINQWDLPDGYTRENWADWEPENPFIAERVYEVDPLAPNAGYEQSEMERIFGRMAERKEEEDEIYKEVVSSMDFIAASPSSASLPVDQPVAEPKSPRFIGSTTEITIRNTLLSPSGKRQRGILVSVADSNKPSEGSAASPKTPTEATDSRKEDRGSSVFSDYIDPSHEHQVDTQVQHALDPIGKTIESEEDGTPDEAGNESIDSTQLEETSLGISPPLRHDNEPSLSAQERSSENDISTVQEQPSPPEDCGSNFEVGKSSSPHAESPAEITSARPSTSTSDQDQASLLAPIEVEVKHVNHAPHDDIDPPSSPASTLLLTPESDSRIPEDDEHRGYRLQYPPQFVVPDHSNAESPFIARSSLKTTISTDQDPVQTSSPPSTPPASLEQESSTVHLTVEAHLPRHRSTISSPSLSYPDKDKVSGIRTPRSLSPTTGVSLAAINLIHPALRFGSADHVKSPSPPEESHESPGPTADRMDDIIPQHRASQLVPSERTPTSDASTQGSISPIGNLPNEIPGAMTDAITSPSIGQNMSKDDKQEVLNFIASQALERGLNDDPILINIHVDSERSVDDEPRESGMEGKEGGKASCGQDDRERCMEDDVTEGAKGDGEAADEEGTIEVELMQSRSTISEMPEDKEAGEEAEEGTEADGDHESISESCELGLSYGQEGAVDTANESTSENHGEPAPAYSEEEQQIVSPETAAEGKPKGRPGRKKAAKPKSEVVPEPRAKRSYTKRPPSTTTSSSKASNSKQSTSKLGRAKTSMPPRDDVKPRVPLTSTRGRAKTAAPRVTSVQAKSTSKGKGKATTPTGGDSEEDVMEEATDPILQDTHPGPPLSSSSSSVPQPSERQAAQRANAAFKTQQAARDYKPNSNLKKSKKRTHDDVSESPDPLGSTNYGPPPEEGALKKTRHASSYLWTPAEDAVLLQFWDGKASLTDEPVQQALQVLTESGIGCGERTHGAVKFRQEEYLNRAKAYAQAQASASK